MRRRFVLAAVAQTGFLARATLAWASTPVELYHVPAIAVKAPAEVLLEAVTYAGHRLVAVGEHGVVIYSDDDAQSWTQARAPVDVTLNCVRFANPLVGWAAGHFGVVLGTVDGGETWALQLDGKQANVLTMEAAKAAVAAGSQVPGAALAMRRADFFIAGGPDLPFFTLLVLSPRKLFVFGAYRLAMVSEDGGKSWADCSLDIYEKFSDDVFDAKIIGNTIYLVGGAGSVFSSNNGGGFFTPLATPADVTLFGILAAADGSLLVYGVAGACYHSSDGGKSWVSVNLGVDDNILSGCVLRSGTMMLASQT